MEKNRQVNRSCLKKFTSRHDILRTSNELRLCCSADFYLSNVAKKSKIGVKMWILLIKL